MVCRRKGKFDVTLTALELGEGEERRGEMEMRKPRVLLWVTGEGCRVEESKVGRKGMKGKTDLSRDGRWVCGQSSVAQDGSI